VAVLQRSSFESILFCRAQCRGGVGGLAAIVFGSHPPQYHVVAGTEFGATRSGGLTGSLESPSRQPWGASAPSGAAPHGANTSLFLLRVSYDGVR
jgi:hypothetical protein